MSPAEAHVDYGCPCAGDLLACQRLDLEGDLRIVRQRLANAESTHGFLRRELADLQDRIGRSAIAILDLRARRAELDGQLDDVDDLTA